MPKRIGHSLITALVLLSMAVTCCCGFEAFLQLAGGDAEVCGSASEQLTEGSDCDEHDDHLAEGLMKASRQDQIAVLAIAAPFELAAWTAPVRPTLQRLAWDTRLRLSSPPCERITPLLI